MDSVSEINVDQAECFKAEDKRMILDEIMKKHGSTDVFNDKLKAKFQIEINHRNPFAF